jgi:lysozyme
MFLNKLANLFRKTPSTGDAGLALIKSYEGLRLDAYLDTGGIPTIGYGHTSAAGDPIVIMGQKITEAKANEILKKDVRKFESAVIRLVKVPLSQNQFDALVCFCYNIGEVELSRSTLLRMLNAKDYKGAADQFPRWNKDNGVVLNGLVKRRAAERDLFLKE